MEQKKLRARFRWEVVRISATPVQIREAVAVELPHDPKAVWHFLEDPRSSIALSDRVSHAERLTGTPLGLGQVQLFIHHTNTGRAGSMLEVVAYEPGRRAVTRTLTSPGGGGELVVEPLAAGCRVTQTHWMTLPVGTSSRVAKLTRRVLREHLDDFAQRLANLDSSVIGQWAPA
ncbi:MAG TPA: SRPBCC family protein [Kribbella sp.]